MWGNLGFSYIGLIYLLMLMIPNIIWAKNKPLNYDTSKENKILLFFERIGEVACTTSLIAFNNTNPSTINIRIIWLMISFCLMLAYEVYFINYFKSEKTLNDFYGKFLGVLYPGATLPICALLLLGIYGRLLPLIISTIVMAIGHIGIHHQHYQDIINSNK